jgi:hypothetical protein
MIEILVFVMVVFWLANQKTLVSSTLTNPDAGLIAALFFAIILLFAG